MKRAPLAERRVCAQHKLETCETSKFEDEEPWELFHNDFPAWTSDQFRDLSGVIRARGVWVVCNRGQKYQFSKHLSIVFKRKTLLLGQSRKYKTLSYGKMDIRAPRLSSQPRDPLLPSPLPPSKTQYSTLQLRPPSPQPSQDKKDRFRNVNRVAIYCQYIILSVSQVCDTAYMRNCIGLVWFSCIIIVLSCTILSNNKRKALAGTHGSGGASSP